ncbi:hypothetical protein NQ315_012231 [Exocentrus adspersus]|uniref:DDE Tnp4 domain-containing protein n=1 Tax=Exocentrus adspersus TaxID=1586481 RepID=A0AAV8V8M2_9CUCU|nr:hypothetical protein NQ315_012231 [Exocentrus adspersus]
MENMFTELLHEPCGEFENFCRMSSTDFQYLLTRVSPFIFKNDTQLREAIPVKVRLAITLRFLATGDSYRSLHFLFKVSSQIISRIVPEVCDALNNILKDEIKNMLKEKIRGESQRGFLRAKVKVDELTIDLCMKDEKRMNYYLFLQAHNALVDSNFCFTFADIGSQGRISDGGVLRNSLLWQEMCSNELQLPEPCPLPGSNIEAPFVVLADGAFALSAHILKPYPGSHELGSPKRIFNQRLSSTRVVVENAFGILSSVFRIFRKPIALEVNKVSLITMTCVRLHNFLRRSKTCKQIYTPTGTVDILDDDGSIIRPGSWRQEISGTCAIRSLENVARRPSLHATEVREKFKSYFCNM